jgi:hypothetical protein
VGLELDTLEYLYGDGMVLVFCFVLILFCSSAFVRAICVALEGVCILIDPLRNIMISTCTAFDVDSACQSTKTVGNRKTSSVRDVVSIIGPYVLTVAMRGRTT